MLERHVDADLIAMSSLSAKLARIAIVAGALYAAYDIRLLAVRRYGPVIHEFDPWFNYRAAEYMVQHGWQKFQAWYDEEVWYPLGRHVGSTTYPGLQLTAYAIHTALGALGSTLTLNEICVYIPAWFGAVASAFAGLLAWEVSGSADGATAAVAVMAILPAHLMRSVAGGFDNEAIAITAIIATFYFWVRSLRTDRSWPWAIACAAAYVYLVAAWGGYIFVLNMLGIHAAVLVGLGRSSSRLWRAYTIWFVLGTAGAVFGPARYLVGWQPFQSLEQLGPTAVFGGIQLLQLADTLAARRNLSAADAFVLRLKIIGGTGALVALAVGIVLPDGYIGPLSARVRGLFIKHTKTGNPLVDSVAEHQATNPRVYYQYFHAVGYAAPAGLIPLLYRAFAEGSDAALFLLTYLCIGMYFSGKMVRLVLLLSPPAAVAAGVYIGAVIRMATNAWSSGGAAGRSETKPADKPAEPEAMAKGSPKPKFAKPKAARQKAKRARPAGGSLWSELAEAYDEAVSARRACAAILLLFIFAGTLRYVPHCLRISRSLSEPQIVLTGRDKQGDPVIIDDFREAYWWLRDHTPEDARVMAWWDYGYQINGVANRTTIADGNTWNHEHIALLGKCLVSSENVSHAITRHLADYVLVWTTRHAGVMKYDDVSKVRHAQPASVCARVCVRAAEALGATARAVIRARAHAR